MFMEWVLTDEAQAVFAKIRRKAHPFCRRR